MAATNFLMNAPQDYCFVAIEALAQEIISGIQNQDGLTKEILATHIVQGGIVAEFPSSHAMMWRNLIMMILNSEDPRVAELGADLEEEIEDQALKEVEVLWSVSLLYLPCAFDVLSSDRNGKESHNGSRGNKSEFAMRRVHRPLVRCGFLHPQ